MRGAAFLLLAAVAATPVAGQRTLTIERFHATIVVNQDGTMDVDEAITARFTGSWNGIYRTIPVEYHTPQGFNWTLRLDIIGATDGEGHRLRLEQSREGHYLKAKIWVPGAENATRAITLRYRVRNGLRFFADHDELYWNVTGDEWDIPIERASAEIDLPAAATGIRALAFNGVYGSTARDAVVDTAGTTVTVTMPHRLEFHEGLTAVVGWNKGVVAEPTATDRALDFGSANWPLGIPFLVFAGMFTLWRRHGRDPEQRPVVVQYEPADDLTPAEAGTLMDESADMRDITATLVDLAVRGYLKIEEREDTHLFGLIKRTEYLFHRQPAPTGVRGLYPHEQRVMDGIFASGSTVKLSDLDEEFYTHLGGIRNGIFDQLVSRGLYRTRPDRVKARWTVGAILLFGLILVPGAIIGARFNLTPLPVFIAAGASALIVGLFGRVMPARTEKGARALERVLGFEEFLRRVEGERFERIVKTPEMFERFLPFAMAFQVEKRWAKAFADIYREPPQWYVGSNMSGFNVGHFSSRLSEMTSRTASTMSSSPRSSGGSGFSGGSSGGGGGGGGGGGF